MSPKVDIPRHEAPASFAGDSTFMTAMSVGIASMLLTTGAVAQETAGEEATSLPPLEVTTKSKSAAKKKAASQQAPSAPSQPQPVPYEPPAEVSDGGGDGRGGINYSEDYQVKRASTAKFTAPLLDTPKSVTVVTRKEMDDRAANSLTEVLRTVPGVTLGSGEGGTSLGDRPFIRGFEASGDMSVDGVRNLGRASYEVFNLEAVELNKGPGGTYNGRGSTGGNLNMVSKAARDDKFFNSSTTLGTDATKRQTIDGNYATDSGVAFRLNAMWHDADVAGRDEVFHERWGIAPSLAFGLNGPTRATFSYYHLETDELPDFGHPVLSGTQQNPGRPLNMKRDAFYGAVNRDFRETETNLATVKFEHDFSDWFRVQNITRYADSLNEYVYTRATATTGNTIVNRDVRSARRYTEGILNQTDFTGEFDTGSIGHSFAFGAEFSRERVQSGGFAGVPAILPPDLNIPIGQWPNVFPNISNTTLTTTPFGTPTTTETAGAYLFDTIKLTEQWLVNAGVRYDHYDVDNTVARNVSDMWNYQIGLVYKPVSYGSIYVVHGTSSNPSGETQGQAGNADPGGNFGNNRENLDPEKNRSYEIGTKWDLLNKQLSVAGAIFRTEKTNARATDPTTGLVELIGETVVDGIEVAVTGKLTDRWEIVAGYTYLDAELVDDGAGTNEGNQVKYIAPHSFSLWTTYALTDAFKIGGGAFYMSERFVDDANTRELPSYWRFDAMAAYQLSDNINLQLNVNNIFDETYYDASHVGLFALVAPGRSGLLRADVKF
ncbi:TonB-dependent receptor [Hyphomicrobium sp.]|uniref:TonB-dependent receptor n=1 Tax=Hyphomicrobium sp. TaxID=82 RepID=UPI002FE2F917